MLLYPTIFSILHLYTFIRHSYKTNDEVSKISQSGHTNITYMLRVSSVYITYMLRKRQVDNIYGYAIPKVSLCSPVR